MTKYTYIAIGVALIGMVLVVLITVLTLVGKTEQDTDVDSNTVTVVFKNVSVQAETVSTDAERSKGLSGREALEEGTGMLFIFDDVDTHTFWMPDMHFAIDIIWLDESMKVVHIKENATPESYPEIFTPSASAKYVLEVPAGFSKKWGIVEGTQAIVR